MGKPAFDWEGWLDEKFPFDGRIHTRAAYRDFRPLVEAAIRATEEVCPDDCYVTLRPEDSKPCAGCQCAKALRDLKVLP